MTKIKLLCTGMLKCLYHISSWTDVTPVSSSSLIGSTQKYLWSYQYTLFATLIEIVNYRLRTRKCKQSEGYKIKSTYQLLQKDIERTRTLSEPVEPCVLLSNVNALLGGKRTKSQNQGCSSVSNVTRLERM